MKKKSMRKCLIGAFAIFTGIALFSCKNDDDEGDKNKSENQEFEAKTFDVELTSTSGGGIPMGMDEQKRSCSRFNQCRDAE